MSDHPLTFAESVRNPRETGPREIRRKGNVFVDSNAYFRLSIDSLLHTENVPWSTFSSTTLSQEMCCFFLDDGIDREIALVPAFSLSLIALVLIRYGGVSFFSPGNVFSAINCLWPNGLVPKGLSKSPASDRPQQSLWLRRVRSDLCREKTQKEITPEREKLIPVLPESCTGYFIN